jgi:hypothetical protein
MKAQRSIFRLFVSSTFSDMAQERRILHDRVFPLLKKLCQSKGGDFQVVDLRWGVNEESQKDHKTMAICLGEIKRCQQLTPKPNFLILLGDRYGWEPIPVEIEGTEFEELLNVITPEEKETLNEWYLKDNNASPPEYYLKRFDGKFEDWEPVEGNLREILRQVVDLANLNENSRAKYFQSATHQEIVNGALTKPELLGNDTDPGEHVLACFRKIQGLPKNPKNAYFDNREQQLKELREEIRKRLAKTDPDTDNVYDYEANWSGENKIQIAAEEEFVNRIREHFERIITKQLESVEPVSDLQAERIAQKEFRDDRCKGFVGREEMLSRINEYLRGDERKVMAVIGEGGSGKSALMAQATLKEEYCIYRFIGATPGSASLEGMLLNLAKDLKEKLDVPGDIPTEPRELNNYIQERLNQATAEEPLTVFIDALDQLPDETKSVSELFEIFPEDLPPHAKVVVSALPTLEQNLGRANIIKLPALPDNEGQALLEAWLKEAHRTLQPEQVKTVINGFAAKGLPLYLRLAFEQARHWRSDEEVKPLSPDLDKLINQLIDGLEKEHNPTKEVRLVDRALGLLQASRYGLSEDELQEVLVRDDDFWAAYKKEAHHEIEERKLPAAVWSRMYHDLVPYLVERRLQGTLLLSFFHRQIEEAISRRYDGNDKNYHAELAGYFEAQPLYLDGSDD